MPSLNSSSSSINSHIRFSIFEGCDQKLFGKVYAAGEASKEETTG